MLIYKIWNEHLIYFKAKSLTYTTNLISDLLYTKMCIKQYAHKYRKHVKTKTIRVYAYVNFNALI